MRRNQSPGRETKGGGPRARRPNTTYRAPPYCRLPIKRGSPQPRTDATDRPRTTLALGTKHGSLAHNGYDHDTRLQGRG